MPRILKDWLTAYLEYTDNTEPPLLYREWTGISCIASALQRRCHSGWMRYTHYPNLYVILVGPSGVGKSQALEAAEDLLVELKIPMSPASGSRQGVTQALMEASRIDVMADGTPIGHSSLTIHCSELVNLIGYKDNDFINALNDWYDCGGASGDWAHRTVGRGTETIENVWVNLIGAAVPSTLQEHLPTTAFTEGGFAGRVVFVYAEEPEKEVAVPLLTPKEIKLREYLLHDLEQMTQLYGPFIPTDEWYDLWIDWYHDNRINPPFDQSFLLPYNGRRRVQLSKLCLILSASRGNDRIVTKEDLERGIEILQRVEESMHRTFQAYGTNPNISLFDLIMKYISEVDTTTERELLTRFITYLESRSQLIEILNYLSSAGFCQIHVNGTETRVKYLPNNPWTDIYGPKTPGGT